MFSKILVANRGTIACRIMRTLSRMGIASVAVYAEADADSLHVQMADQSWSLGDGPATDTYLDQEKLFAIARRSGAQAVHPGYGFLSENPAFVEACARQGLVFIGPAAASIRAFGLKHEARALAEGAGVPLIRGSALLSGLAEALVAAAAIGYPLMLKSTAGGGGIGMQICHSAQELESCFDSVVRLGQNHFADGGVFLEKFIARARHIEVQVFGNGRGEAVALGERDCSLQRRHQKVIEETPAPDLSEAVRQALHDTAVQLLASVDYAGAGTVEYIYDDLTEAFYFLEVNTRLQVEHGVTEEVFGVDLVEWMVEQAWSPIADLTRRAEGLQPRGHAIQARIYAENPAADFHPSAGLLSQVEWPDGAPGAARLRIDSWVAAGVEVSSWFDPMLAKVIVHAADRAEAIQALATVLGACDLYGVETNIDYTRRLLLLAEFQRSALHTRFLDQWHYCAQSFGVLSPGTLTTVQDLQGRQGYWHVGIPPSGPFDSYSFRLGNALLGNAADCAGLEITLAGPCLRFNAPTRVLVAGAPLPVAIDGQARELWRVLDIAAGQTLSIGRVSGAGARAYLLVSGGIQCPTYLGSRSTFTLGQFGGHAGRALKTGDVLHFPEPAAIAASSSDRLEPRPVITDEWELRVIYGPHGAPDFFTPADIESFFSASWEVHYNSSRTGIRLLGPKPEWARASGGEAGMHPSNIHDNAYAFGSVDFTGDMPVILGPDGPSLGGFVCPAVLVHADLWKLGQLKAGDKVRFLAVSVEEAHGDQLPLSNAHAVAARGCQTLPSPLIRQWVLEDGTEVSVRLAGDRFVLVEFGEQRLDLALRFRVAALQDYLEAAVSAASEGVLQRGLAELTPGVRSLQLRYHPAELSLHELLALIEQGCLQLGQQDDVRVRSRTVYLPLSWNDPACQQAVDKYRQSVRADAPWCPDNIEFIRRINGLDSVEVVRDIVFGAQYVVMGLGDVYLGAPVATPLDPRHRLVTTKYNPARTWTAENSVGIGGAYLCVYGMEGPGGYQFVGRTLQMWNRYRRTQAFSQPWLLRCFDRIRFYPVSGDELQRIRSAFPRGDYELRIEDGEFSLADYTRELTANANSIAAFEAKRQQAFDEELQRWLANGQLHFESDPALEEDHGAEDLPAGYSAIESSVAGNVWQVLVSEGSRVKVGDTLLILESMKMEIELTSVGDGVVRKILKPEGSRVAAGQVLLHVEDCSP